MPPNQDKTSNGKQIEQIIAHNYFVFYSCIESTHRPSSDTTVGERSNNSKFSTHHQDQSMEILATRERGVHLHTLEDRDAEALEERGCTVVRCLDRIWPRSESLSE